ncbi:hypothetical protein [uncultured Deefgea sp.]|uniref:hypothetical protein n=1 Tax=uncultured Deefgea sp. TaxID=1304914 RepID=UPI0026250378|nr:hypothetical protein [uncultured Deefgea sp.]
MQYKQKKTARKNTDPPFLRLTAPQDERMPPSSIEIFISSTDCTWIGEADPLIANNSLSLLLGR